jgi:hypothetical protein
MSFLETTGLRMVGFTSEQIAQIDAIIPDVARLAAVLKSEMPRINRIVPVVKMAMDVINEYKKETA